MKQFETYIVNEESMVPNNNKITQKKNANDTCSICINDLSIEVEEIVISGCHHIFHMECITRQIQFNKTIIPEKLNFFPNCNAHYTRKYLIPPNLEKYQKKQ